MQFIQVVNKMLRNKTVVFLITLLYIALTCYARFSFTNLNCTALDKSFADFEYCYLKAVNRSYQYWSVKAKLYKIPITNMTVKVALMKRENGYKPFLYDFSFDGCAFFKGRRNPLNQFAYNIIKEYTNMNHTCPYDHDLIIEKLSTTWLNEVFTKKIPAPKGEYALYTTWIAYNIPRATVKVYGKLD